MTVKRFHRRDDDERTDSMQFAWERFEHAREKNRFDRAHRRENEKRFLERLGYTHREIADSRAPDCVNV